VPTSDGRQIQVKFILSRSEIREKSPADEAKRVIAGAGLLKGERFTLAQYLEAGQQLVRDRGYKLEVTTAASAEEVFEQLVTAGLIQKEGSDYRPTREGRVAITLVDLKRFINVGRWNMGNAVFESEGIDSTDAWWTELIKKQVPELLIGLKDVTELQEVSSGFEDWYAKEVTPTLGGNLPSLRVKGHVDGFKTVIAEEIQKAIASRSEVRADIAAIKTLPEIQALMKWLETKGYEPQLADQQDERIITTGNSVPDALSPENIPFVFLYAKAMQAIGGKSIYLMSRSETRMTEVEMAQVLQKTGLTLEILKQWATDKKISRQTDWREASGEIAYDYSTYELALPEPVELKGQGKVSKITFVVENHASIGTTWIQVRFFGETKSEPEVPVLNFRIDKWNKVQFAQSDFSSKVVEQLLASVKKKLDDLTAVRSEAPTLKRVNDVILALKESGLSDEEARQVLKERFPDGKASPGFLLGMLREIAQANRDYDQTVANKPKLRSEVRLVANEIVSSFKGEVKNLNERRVAQTIETTGTRTFIPELLAATEEARTRDDVKAGTDTTRHFDAIKAIDQPVVIEYQVSDQDLARMGANAGAVIASLLQAARDASATNKNIITRINLPATASDLLKLKDHNQRDAVRLEKTSNSVTLYNNGLVGYQLHVTATPTISVTAFNVKGTILFSDRYGDNQEIAYEGADGSKVASQIFVAALVWVADSITQRTFDGLVQADKRPNGYRITNQNALYALSSLIELMAQYRAELRTKIAA
jgi:hypothetical protein